jgi:hypothetical protein
MSSRSLKVVAALLPCVVLATEVASDAKSVDDHASKKSKVNDHFSRSKSLLKRSSGIARKQSLTKNDPFDDIAFAFLHGNDRKQERKEQHKKAEAQRKEEEEAPARESKPATMLDVVRVAQQRVDQSEKLEFESANALEEAHNLMREEMVWIVEEERKKKQRELAEALKNDTSIQKGQVDGLRDVESLVARFAHDLAGAKHDNIEAKQRKIHDEIVDVEDSGFGDESHLN